MAGLRVVSGALFREDGKVLMGLRKKGKRASLWELPGGKVDPDETLEVALVREWREELSLTVVSKDFIASVFLDLEVSFFIDLYVVATSDLRELTRAVHAELAWVDPYEAVQTWPCSPAFYLHWPHLRKWLSSAAQARQACEVAEQEQARRFDRDEG